MTPADDRSLDGDHEFTEDWWVRADFDPEFRWHGPYMSRDAAEADAASLLHDGGAHSVDLGRGHLALTRGLTCARPCQTCDHRCRRECSLERDHDAACHCVPRRKRHQIVALVTYEARCPGGEP